MAAWSGFTDDDLKKMRRPAQTDDPTANSNRKIPVQAQQQKQRREKALRSSSQTDESPESITVRQKSLDRIDPSMKLSKQNRPTSANQSAAVSVTNSLDNTKIVEKTKQPNAEETQSPASEHIVRDESSDGSIDLPDQLKQLQSSDIKELNEDEVLSAETNNVQKFQQRQKVIEEANKYKRALLSKAIVDRQKKAKAEAIKLMKVQQELNHLDTLLTADVNIIRDRIEVASLEYMDAQKRYEKAEKEFIAAKMDLFSKGEAKEHLTEHLYTIIHQNEVRKAKKLVELMEKLAMDVTPEEMELTITAIPQLTNFTAVSTLHDPYHIKNTTDTDKVNVVDIVAGGENISSKEAKDHLLRSSTTVIDSETNISGLHNSHLEKHHSDLQQNNERSLLNQTVPGTDSNKSLETTSEYAPVIKTGSPDTQQNSYQSSELDKVESETIKANMTDKILTGVVKNGENAQTEVVFTSQITDTVLPRSDNGILKSSIQECNETVPQLQSLNVSSAKGWTHPFS